MKSEVNLQEIKSMTTQIAPEGYYTEDQMAKLLGKSKSTLKVDHCRISNRVPPKTKIGNLIIYNKESFENWLKTKEMNFDRDSKRGWNNFRKK